MNIEWSLRARWYGVLFSLNGGEDRKVKHSTSAVPKTRNLIIKIHCQLLNMGGSALFASNMNVLL
jgi:hypothetical protein